MTSTTKGRGPGAKRTARTSVRSHLRPWARDALGIGLVVLALLAMLGLWFGSAGPVGRGLDWLLHATFGLAAVVFPILALYWGLVLLRGTAEQERLRMFIGFSIAAIGVLALLSLWQGNPRPFSGYERLSGAAGAIGALACWPLGKLVSGIGVAIVCGRRWPARAADLHGHTAVRDLGPDRGCLLPRGRGGRGGRRGRGRRGGARRAQDRAQGHEGSSRLELPDEGEEEEPEAIEVPALVRPSRSGPYELPPLELLRTSPPSASSERDEEHQKAALERTFHTFGVPAHVVAAHRGPTVTLYEVEVEAGTKVNKVLSLADDIAYALATPDVRIIAPIPGRSAIGVEVPNKVRDFVMLGDILRSKTATDDEHPLAVALGKDVHGRAQLGEPHADAARADRRRDRSRQVEPHQLVHHLDPRCVPTPTKSSWCSSTPKRVELVHFADLPHLLVPVIVHPKRAAEALAWVVREMEERYELLAMVGVRDIDGYRAGLKEETLRIPPGQEDRVGRLPVPAGRDRRARRPHDGRAARRRGRDLPDRPDGARGRDPPGRRDPTAERRRRHGPDQGEHPEPDRAHDLEPGGLARDPGHERCGEAGRARRPAVRAVLGVQANAPPGGVGDGEGDPGRRGLGSRTACGRVRDERRGPRQAAGGGEENGGLGGDDDLLEQAADLVIRSQLGSTSMLQRKLKVGFARAGRLMDLLEDRGIVGPSLGSKARDVLVTPEEWEESRSTRTGS